jgi:glycosyltransferase involved in cell wall biosynthesis
MSPDSKVARSDAAHVAETGPRPGARDRPINDDGRPGGRLHIAHIIDELPPDGAERLLVDVLKYREGPHRYSVVCLIAAGPLEDELRQIGVPVVVLGRRSRLDWTLVRRLRDWLVREDVRVVHTHLFTADCVGRIAARLAGVRCIFSTVHSTNAWKGRLHRLVDWTLSRITSRVIACSHEVGEVLVRRDHVPWERVAVITNGIDRARFDRVERADLVREFGIPEGVLVMAVIGRLHRAKGHADLLPALEALAVGFGAFRCLFIGDGELRDELMQAVRERGLEDKVIFTGRRDDVPALLKSIDIVVMPSRWEGLPIALLEAMAMSKPVLAAAVGGIPGVVEHGRTGLLVEPGDLRQMAGQLKVLSDDPRLRARLGEQAREVIQQRYDIQFTSRRYHDLYEQAWRILARPSRPRRASISRGPVGIPRGPRSSGAAASIPG